MITGFRIHFLLFTAVIFFFSCDDILDIYPPELTVLVPQNGDLIQDSIYVELEVADADDLEKVEIITLTEYGDKFTEVSFTTAPFQASFPVWTRSIDQLKIKAKDVNGNFGFVSTYSNIFQFTASDFPELGEEVSQTIMSIVVDVQYTIPIDLGPIGLGLKFRAQESLGVPGADAGTSDIIGFGITLNYKL